MSQLLRPFSPLFLSLIAAFPSFGQPYPAPAPIFSRIFGGASGWDIADGIAVDPQGNVAVAGTTTSPDFPIDNAIDSQISRVPLVGTNGNRMLFPPNLGAAVDVTALAESPDGSTIYSASSSGIFVSVDGGMRWSQQFPGLAGAHVLAVDPTDSNVLYAGTPGTMSLGPGALFKSVDGGRNWSSIQLAALSDLAYPSGASSLQVSERGVYALIGAIYRSTDGGNSWTALKPGGLTVFAFGVAPSDGNVIYAVTADGLVYRSANAGTSWSTTGASFPVAYPSIPPGALAVDPSNPDRLWTVAGNNVFRSTDAGASFQLVYSATNSRGLRWISLSPVAGRLMAGGLTSAWYSKDNGVHWNALTYQSPVNAILATPGAFFAGMHGATDGFLSKWSSDGNRLLFSTYLSGANGLHLAEDSAGETYVTGITTSARFPVTRGAPVSAEGMQQAFLAKFDPRGNLNFSELLGPNLFSISSMAVDSTGDVYVLTSSSCTDAPRGAPLVLEFDPRGNQMYSRALSELCGGQSTGNAIAVAPSGDVYVTGSTAIQDLPTSPTAVQPLFFSSAPTNPLTAAEDGYLLRLSPQSSSITYLTYLGDSASGLALDSTGNLYVSGEVTSFPATLQPTADLAPPADCGIQTFAYVMKLNFSSSVPLWLTTWGGGCHNSSNSVAVDQDGNVWAGGQTDSTNFPSVSPVFLRGLSDTFVTELNPGGTQILFSSFIPRDGNFALGPDNSLYLGGSVIPHAGKTNYIGVSGLAGPTSILVERLDTTAARGSVIDTITNTNSTTVDQDPLLFWIAPGEMIRVRGRGLGPATAAGAQFDANGRVSSSVAGTRILFDGVPAPLISVQDSEVICIAPFEIGLFASTNVQVERNGVAAPAVAIGVKTVASDPDVLAVANPDGTANSESNFAHWGQTITLYVTGFGDTIPSVPDGSIYQAPLPVPAVPLFTKEPYAGPAPGMVAGIWQINVPLVKPSGEPPNPVNVLVLSITQNGVNPGVWVVP